MEERWENNTCYQTQWPENTSFHSTQHISVILCWLLPWMETWGPFTNIVIITDLISYNPLVDPNGPRGLWQSTEWLYACSIDYYLWCFVLKVNTYDHQCVFTVKRRKLFPYNFEEAITAHLYVIWCCLWDWRGCYLPQEIVNILKVGQIGLPQWSLNNLCQYCPTQTLPSLKVCKDGWCLKVWMHLPIVTMIYIVVLVVRPADVVSFNPYDTWSVEWEIK